MEEAEFHGGQDHDGLTGRWPFGAGALAVLLGFLATATVEGADARFVDERHAYVRGESVRLRLRTGEGDEVAFDVSGWLPEKAPVRDGEARYELETAGLHAGDYEVKGQRLKDGRPLGGPVVFPVSIAPERNPQRFPVWNWGGRRPRPRLVDGPRVQWPAALLRARPGPGWRGRGDR
jgi:hypothetical protein